MPATQHAKQFRYRDGGQQLVAWKSYCKEIYKVASFWLLVCPLLQQNMQSCKFAVQNTKFAFYRLNEIYLLIICFLLMQPLFSLDLILPKAQAPSHSHRWFHWAAALLASWEINCQVTGSQWEDHPAPQVLHLTQLCNKISGFARWGQKLDAEYSSFCSLLLSLIFWIRVIMSEINPNLPAFFQVTT